MEPLLSCQHRSGSRAFFQAMEVTRLNLERSFICKVSIVWGQRRFCTPHLEAVSAAGGDRDGGGLCSPYRDVPTAPFLPLPPRDGLDDAPKQPQMFPRSPPPRAQRCPTPSGQSGGVRVKLSVPPRAVIDAHSSASLVGGWGGSVCTARGSAPPRGSPRRVGAAPCRDRRPPGPYNRGGSDCPAALSRPPRGSAARRDAQPRGGAHRGWR